MSANAFIAVHGGAGFHPTKFDKDVKKALRDACSCALSNLKSKLENETYDTCALGMVEDAISSLEDNEHLNAGYGSNLTLNGTVECDAAIMAGRASDFGSVGAVSGVKNPIRLARTILEYSHTADKLGRVAPMTLVSEGARSFALSYPEKVQLQPAGSQVTPRAHDQWQKWMARLDAPAGAMVQPRVDNPETVDDDDDDGSFKDRQDTVGAVAWHTRDGVAAGVSSGGLLLKFPGRVGEAAVYGAGCWVQESMQPKQAVGCSVSGTGEYIVRANLACKVGEAVLAAAGAEEAPDPHEILQRILTEDLWKPARRKGEADPSVGVLLFVIEEEVSARLWCAFTTPSMAIAYASLHDPKPKAVILRRPAREMGSVSKPDEPHMYITALTL